MQFELLRSFTIILLNFFECFCYNLVWYLYESFDHKFFGVSLHFSINFCVMVYGDHTSVILVSGDKSVLGCLSIPDLFESYL